MKHGYDIFLYLVIFLAINIFNLEVLSIECSKAKNKVMGWRKFIKTDLKFIITLSLF